MVEGKAFGDGKMKEKRLEKGGMCSLGRDKYTTVIGGKEEKGIGISVSHRIVERGV